MYVLFTKVLGHYRQPEGDHGHCKSHTNPKNDTTAKSLNQTQIFF